MNLVLKAEAVESKIRKAVRKKCCRRKSFELLDEAKAKSVITTEEYSLIEEAASARLDAIKWMTFPRPNT